MYLADEIDRAWIPPEEQEAVLTDPAYQDEIVRVFTNNVFYFQYAYDKPPFDNVHVRRAFSAIVDRQLFVDQLENGMAIPMIHLTPPGLVHAPPIDGIGVGFDPEYAVSQMAQGGYANCEGFPEIEIMTYTGAIDWGVMWAAAAEQYLGCDPELFAVTPVQFSRLLEAIDAAPASDERPNAWTLGWGPDYNDAHSFVGDILWCQATNSGLRPCNEIDALIDQAVRENDTVLRTEMYAQIEEAFFGHDGEYPLVPLYLNIYDMLVKPWYTGPHGFYARWDEFSIDMEAKLAARGD
jgi:ABC-type oligopeptide transport system substrate-binding subunit